jgi:hypothetical protein
MKTQNDIFYQQACEEARDDYFAHGARKTDEDVLERAEQLRKIDKIAEICHNVNKAFCESNNDFSQVSWQEAPNWVKEPTINGVKHMLDSDVTPEMSHEEWVRVKVEDGWVYGEEKNGELKTHPCILPYHELPQVQKTKDLLFKAVVDSFK